MAVRGHQAYTRSVSPGIKFLAHGCDAALSAALVLGGIASTQASPVPHPLWAAAWLAAAAGLAGFSRAVIGRTPGEAIWSLALPQAQRDSGRKPAGLERIWKPDLRQLERQSAETLFTGISLTLLSFVVLGLTAQRALFTNPIWEVAPAAELEPFIPGFADEANRWVVAPFFYSLGAWPTSFAGSAVFHVAPYEKGPPQRFPGKIIARWDPPHAKLTFEGPKTPMASYVTPQAALSRDRIAECFRPASLPSPSCLRIRETVLGRHLREIDAALRGAERGSWRVEWFTVRNPALSERETAQGFRIHAHASDRAQERYILITPQGTHQAFILDYPRNDSGWEALALLEKSIRSLRVSDDLNPGRAWIDARLERVRMADLKSLEREPQKLLSSLSEIQLLLLSKISVDPATFETYFHLGGLGLTLLRHALKNFDFSRSDDWKSVARPTIEAAARFAEDVKPSDPRVSELRNYALEAQKY